MSNVSMYGYFTQPKTPLDVFLEMTDRPSRFTLEEASEKYRELLKQYPDDKLPDDYDCSWLFYNGKF